MLFPRLIRAGALDVCIFFRRSLLLLLMLLRCESCLA
jgi:hypothetical protein